MPPRDPDNLQRQLEQLFHGLVYHRLPAAHFSDAPWAPAADLVVSKHSARVLFELAGVPREDIQVRLLGNLLEISGRRQPPQEPSGAHYHRAEIFFGNFRRIVELPWPADPEHVSASYKDGLLEVKLKALRNERIEVSVEPGHGSAVGGEPR